MKWSNEVDIDNKWSCDLIKIILIRKIWWSNEVDVDNKWSVDLIMKLILITNDLVI